MKKGLTTILYVLDRSGSMGTIWDDAVKAFDRFLAEQKAVPGDAEFGLTYFDTEISRNPITPLQEAATLASQAPTVFPRGGTALLDAVGKTVSEAGAEFAGRAEGSRPERVLLVIQTDGEENSSKEYKAERVKEMVQHQKDRYGWEVIFMGADQDAWKAGNLFAASASLSFNNANQNAAALYVSDNASAYRTTGSLRDLGTTDIRTP